MSNPLSPQRTELTPKRSHASIVLFLACVAQLMVVLDVSVVMVALPQMRHDLHLSVSGQQWVVNAYTLTFAGFLLLGEGPPTFGDGSAFSCSAWLCSPGSASSVGWPRTALGWYWPALPKVSAVPSWPPPH